MNRVAFIHLLPLERYPPARNSLVQLQCNGGCLVRAWSSRDPEGLREWRGEGVEVRRPAYPGSRAGVIKRVIGLFSWHFRVSWELAKWRPDVVISVEPHSAFAVWLYFRVLRGKARLFIHHHEYYAPEDFEGPGMRLLKRLHALERRDLYPRAEWISQTNAERLRLLREWSPMIREEVAAVLPNHPPAKWSAKARRRNHGQRTADGRMRLVYVGSASFRDTFMREVVEWVARFPDELSLHVCGHNIDGDVWEWLAAGKRANVSMDCDGLDYEDLPELLTQFDVGLVLYKGNTLNFVYNVPNKAIEYLNCGLEVWYPPEMEGMRIFQTENSNASLREMNFKQLPDQVPDVLPCIGFDATLFTCEAAMEPLLAEIQRLGREKR